ncbi:hypothetical protein BGZ94_009435, partial [Podila epigama]
MLVFTSSDIAQPTLPPNAQPITHDDVWHSYTIYLFLWQNLLSPSSLSQDLKLDEVLIDGKDKEAYLRTLYGSLMLSFKRLVSLLNLSVSDAHTDLDEDETDFKMPDIGVPLAPASGDIAKMHPHNSKDFIIFQNLTEFWQLFLPATCPELFGRWAFTIGSNLIELSAKNPLVSGFYKMFATCLQVCEATQLFAPTTNESDVKTEVLSPVELQRTISLFKKYVAEVMARLEQYKDDLLGSCLQLVLSSPSALTDAYSVIPPIQIALKLGLGHFPLASIGLDAIERWMKIVDQDDETWFKRVLPSLDEYLKVHVPSTNDSDGTVDTTSKSKLTYKSGKSSTYIAILKNSKAVTTPEQVQSLRDLQLRILRLLGEQARFNKLILAKASSQDEDKKEASELLAWDTEARVKFKIPFQEMKTELQFDEMLPRIVDLAENSLNRQIKVASCELLHSLMVLMIGSSAFRARDAQDPRKSPFHKIYLRLFPALLRLSVDLDRVPRSLFRPLVSQLIHWLTNGAQYENPETIALLNCCMDAACDSLGPLRDFGAECLGEFVQWSIKQTASSQSSVNIKSLLKRVYNLASHSVPSKRLGASLIVNRIYRTFREESTLVNQFTLELLYWMLFSLRSAETDHVGLGTRQQARTSILHLQKIIVKKSSVFLRDAKDRRRFPGSNEATLEGLVLWLLKETSRPEVEYTKMCRSLFDSFVKLLPESGAGGTSAWISARLQKEPTFITDIYSGPEKRNKMYSTFDLYQAWCAELASMMTNYTWLLSQTGNSDKLQEQLMASPVIETIAKFMKRCLWFTESNLSGDVKGTPLTPLERRRIMDHNFATIRKMITFVATLSSKDTDGALVRRLQEAELLGPKFYNVFATCLFDPDSIGNDELLKSESEIVVLASELEFGLRAFGKVPNGGIIRELGKSLHSTLVSEALNPLTLSLEDLKVRDPIKSKAVLDGLILLLPCGTLRFLFGGSGSKSNDFIEAMFKTFMPLQSTQDPLWIQYCSSLLQLTLADSECHKTLWSVILDKNKVDEGLMIYQKYNHAVNRQLALYFSDVSGDLVKAAAYAPHLLSIWNDFLDFLFAHPELTLERSTFLTMLTSDFALLKEIVDTLVKDEPSTKIAIWRRVVALSPRILRISQSPGFVDYFFNIFQSFFERNASTQEYLSLPVMSEAFSILPVFLSHGGPKTEEFEKVFARALMTVIPNTSSDYERGSSRFKDYISALDLLLKALIASSNVPLFKLLMGIAIRESQHPHMEHIQQSTASFALKLPLSKFLETTHFCFENFMERNHSDEHRRNIIHQILLPILKIVPPLSVSEFFVQNIVRIMEVIKQDIPRGSDFEMRRDYIERECAYDLIHVLYMRLPSEMVNTKESKIVMAFTKGKVVTGKELTLEITLSPEVAVLRDGFKRAAYNALAAAILCTQRKEDFFRQFLFRDNEAKKEFVWENIVDLNAVYHFDQILDGPLVKTRLSDLRARSLDPSKTSRKYQYMSSQYLRDSSLSQSVGIIDSHTMFNDTEDESSNNSQEESTDATEKGAVTKPVSAVKVSDADQMLELDAINSNVCMKMIMLIIHELHTSITPPPAEMTKEDGQMPPWMRDIHRKLVNPAIALNIRLFLAKIIVNLPQAFEKYAQSWVRPLMRLVMEGDSFGDPMSYFVQDLCVLIVVWGESVKLTNSYDDRVLLLNFLSYLMKHCYHESRAYHRNNIEIIKGVFENWSSIAIVPTFIIYKNFSNMKDDKKNLSGIQLLGIVLTHDNPPFYKGPEIDLGTLTEQQYSEALVRNMKSTSKAVYTSAAEVCGLVLAYMRRHNVMDDGFLDLVTSTLSDMLIPDSRSNKGKNPLVSFINCLHKIQLNFQELTDTFGPRILFHFSQLLGEERTMALEILAGRAKELPDLFQSLQGLNFLGCLRHKDEKTQFAALSVVFALQDTLKEDQILDFLDTMVAEFSHHSSLECRKFYYSILIVFYEKQNGETPLTAALRTQLLRGLGDSSESIRRTVVEFWYGKNRLPLSTFPRLEAIVRTMYDPQAEDTFLSYATYILLDRTKNSSDYNEPIFSESLPNARFSDKFADIDTSWRSTAAMTPLFVHTQSSQAGENDRLLEADELRATQATFEFSLTMEGGTQGIRSQLGGAAGSGSALMFRSGPSANRNASGMGTQSDSSPSQKYERLQYRNTTKSTSITTSRFIRAFENRTLHQTRVRVDKELARTKSVAMIRKYREGDLPDIQISYADILRPLQILAEMDVEICRMLFSKLVTSLLHQANTNAGMTESEVAEYKDGLMLCFKQMLERSTLMYTPFVGSILRICHDYGKYAFPATLITRASDRSSNQHLGIILLEKQIQSMDQEERSTKRHRTSLSSAQDKTRATWNELALLYKSVDEKDIYKSVFENNVATTEYTKEAIEAEVLGDYNRAAQAYFDGIAKLSSDEIEIDDAEKTIWANGRLECLEYLGDWDILEQNMMMDMENDSSVVWTEDYIDPYLHYYLTCYTKLVDGRTEDGMLESWTADNPNPLFDFLHKAMNDAGRRQILTSQYQAELAVASVIERDFKQASHYVRMSYDRFLSNWSSLHPLSDKPRLHELAGLQRVVELDEFLNSVDQAQKSANANPLLPLLGKWENRYPGKTTDSIVTWNNVVDDRKLMIRRLGEWTQLSGREEKKVLSHQIHYQKRLAAAARSQGNFFVAEKGISAMEDLGASKYDLYETEFKVSLAKAEAETDRTQQALSLIEVIAEFHEHERTNNFDAQQVVDLSLLGSNAYGMLCDSMLDDRKVMDQVREVAWVRQNVGSEGTDLVTRLQERGFNLLSNAESTGMDHETTRKLRLTVARYCDKILRHAEEKTASDSAKEKATTQDLSIYARLVITNTLQAMNEDEHAATELFPRLLQLIELYPDTQKTFVGLVSNFTRCWTFVRWIQQMVAVLDKPIGICIMPILKAIAQQYPNAIYYPLAISCENYVFEDSPAGRKRRDDVLWLQQQVRSDIKEDFIFELRRLTNADHLLKDWLEQTV